MFGLEIGTVAGWVTALSSLGIFGAVSTLVVAWWRRGVSLKGLQNAAEADIRDHYAEELKRYTGEIAQLREQLRSMEDHYRRMLEQSDRRHDDCENARLVMRDELEGLKAQLRTQASDRVLRLEENCASPSPMVADAARRVKNIVGDGK